MGIISSQLLKSIEWLDNSKNTIVFRFPTEGKRIVMSSKLTVRDGQVAVFVNKGKIADVFEPGIYNLSTSNLPFLTAILSLPFGFKSPFFSEVYFVNTKQFTNQKWGTSSPITMRDAEFGTVRVRGFGTYSFKVNEPTILLKELFGTNETFKSDDIATYLKSQIVTGISDVIASSKISAIDLSTKLDEFGKETLEKMKENFTSLGLKLVNFNIENISFPEEIEKALDMRASMGVMGDKMDSFMKFQTANALREAANNESGLASMGASIGAGVAMSGAFKEAYGKPVQDQNAHLNFAGTCSKCNAPFVKGAKFCSECGAKATKGFCVECGNKLPAGAKFCPGCGKKQ